jgi:uncharacterized protein
MLSFSPGLSEGMVDLPTLFTGFVVGLVVGMTGIGGGSLMTPVLVLLFGIAPQTAVGTDLLFACITKIFGAFVHGQKGAVDWEIVRRLSYGSLPAAAFTVVLLAYIGGGQIRSGIILTALAVALLVTAGGLLARTQLHNIGKRLRTEHAVRFKQLQPSLTMATGAVVGSLVALTSVGAGALGTVALVYLYPYRLKPAKLVGTDIAHAIPLALVAGGAHLLLRNPDFALLGKLLMGSIPGIILGSILSARVSETFVRNAIAAIMVMVAVRLLL